MPLSTRYLSIKAIFRPFPAADGQIGGHMDIILAVLNRIFHGLSFDISHDHQKNEKYLGVTTPIYAPRGGVRVPPPQFFLKSKKYRLKYPCMPIFRFLGHKVWLCSPPPSDNGLSRISPLDGHGAKIW